MSDRPVASLIVTHLDELLTVAGPGPRRGPGQRDVESIPDGAVAGGGERIVAVGSTGDVLRRVAPAPDAVVVDGRGRALVPGFVDPHTHVVYAGDRRPELRRRLAGDSYAAIAAAGGGILGTVRATRAASEGDLASATAVRLAEMLAGGTTTAEAKSGYGLDTASELRMLRVIRALHAEQPIDLVSTFMGAHEVPPEYRGRQADFVRLVIDEMTPQAAPLAEWCDVFCDRGFFTVDESRALLEAGRRAGLKLRLHADELAASGGAELAAEMGVRSADHLVQVTPAGIAALEAAGVVATLLPCAAFYLKLGRFAPARDLVAAGVPVALATDVNPGGGFSPSPTTAMSIACFAMGLTFEEALVGATLNAAYALDRHDTVGSLEVGKLFDAVLVDAPAINLIRLGAPGIRAVFKRGRQVIGDPIKSNT
ncbi:MAG TPA: imidazolonepropionase [Vicinamibacterales bacterium]|nr:imidazolonepropionase [Vicinamibacterales bacterium]